MKNKIIIPFLVLLLIFASCKKELAKKPNHLIEKDKMVNIIYDLSLLNAMRSQNSALLDSFKNNSNEYIYKKYKIDSAQFAQSNIYYAADFKEYQKMYEQVKLRLNKDKKYTEATIKVEKKKADLLKKKKAKRELDSINKAKQMLKLKTAKVADSLSKLKKKAI